LQSVVPAQLELPEVQELELLALRELREPVQLLVLRLERLGE